MNNKTTATAPLRASEMVDVLSRQISGLIKREGAGQFENVQPAAEPVAKARSVKKKK